MGRPKTIYPENCRPMTLRIGEDVRRLAAVIAAEERRSLHAQIEVLLLEALYARQAPEKALAREMAGLPPLDLGAIARPRTASE